MHYSISFANIAFFGNLGLTGSDEMGQNTGEKCQEKNIKRLENRAYNEVADRLAVGLKI